MISVIFMALFFGSATFLNYYPRINVGLLKINTGKLRIGDEILILGKTTGVVKEKVESMEIEHKKIQEGKKGDMIGILLPFCRKGDELYRVVKNKI